MADFSLFGMELTSYITRLKTTLRAMGTKKGQRGLGWYDFFFEVLLEAAEELGIPATTAGDRTRNPHATPLTMLAQALEQSLPKEAQARTLAGCAKRVQEHLKKRKRTRE